MTYNYIGNVVQEERKTISLKIFIFFSSKNPCCCSYYQVVDWLSCKSHPFKHLAPLVVNALLKFYCSFLPLQYQFINMYYGKAHEKNKNWMDTSSFNLASDYTVEEQKIPPGFSFLAREKRFLFLCKCTCKINTRTPKHKSMNCNYLKTNSQYD
ncbi:unnamed protein product [Trifolium pratense]|uniref:Uncharacterized protein n=1 Tax=Trifolium pratense TaxID=57577 RepID=A0ACB0JFJ7_TRIPR|nr:unnamed protein product [Trifolium pratense]